MRLALLFVLILISSTPLLAQSLGGTVLDEKNLPLPGASVETFASDSTRKAAVTDAEGRFAVNLRPGTYNVRIRFIGYQTITRNVTVPPQGLALGNLQMQPDVQMLRDAVVTADAVPVEQKGDTTQFSAEAFSTLPDASAEDLVRKMPGVVVENGAVKSQGEEVQQVLVDGKPFFGKDPSAALKNLPADMIDKVQVYNRQTDQAKFSGVNDGEDTKTINLITKKDRRQGNFGKITAGAGTDERFSADAKWNLFKGDARLTVTGGLNNINEQNFQSMVFGGGRFRGGMFTLPGMTGRNDLGNVGIQYQDQWADNLEVNMSYFFDSNNKEEKEQRTATYLSAEDSGRTIFQNTQVFSSNSTHRFDARIQWDIDSNNTLLFTPEFRTGYGTSNSLESSSTSLNRGLLNRIFGSEQTNSGNWSLESELEWQHKFRKEGRTLSWEIDVDGEGGNGDGEFLTRTDNLDTNGVTEVLRLTDSYSRTLDYSTRLVYTEPLSSTSRLLFEYQAGNRDASSYNLTRPAADAAPDTVLSQDVFSRFTSHRAGMGYSLNGKVWGVFTRLRYQLGELRTESEYPAPGTYTATYGDLIPTASIRYQTDKQQFRIFYRGDVDLPSASQLQDRYSISSPLRITSGNSRLDRAYTNRIFLRYNWADASSGWNFSAFAMPNWQNQYIGQETFIARKDTLLSTGVLLPNGGQYTRPVNLNGYLAANTDLMLGFPLKKIKGNGRAGLGYSASRIPSRYDGVEILTTQQDLNGSLGYASNFSERWDLNWTSRYHIQFAENANLGGVTEYNWWQHQLGFKGRIGKGWVVSSDLEQRTYNGLDLADPSYWLWKASVGYKFAKDRGEFRVTAFDLLNQNQSLTRNVQPLYTEDVQQLTLGQYFLFSFIWEWKSFEGAAPENSEPNRRMHFRHR